MALQLLAISEEKVWNMNILLKPIKARNQVQDLENLIKS